MDDVSVASDTSSGNLPVEQAQVPADRRAALWRVAIFAVLALFVGFLAIGLQRAIRSERRAMGMAPDFTVTTFEGETIRLSDLRGKGVVLNFWASWCVPCRTEAPLLEQAWRRERDRGIIFIGLDYLDQEHAAKAFLDEFDITYPTGPDLQSAAARHYGITGVPETFFIAPDGRIVSTVIGPISSPSDLDQRLDAIRPAQ